MATTCLSERGGVAVATAPKPWLISAGWDCTYFIGAPLLAIIVLIPLSRMMPPGQYSILLLSFFTFGHHLPGFMRAYGDPELFRRFRWRFLLAPPLVFLAALLFEVRSLHGLLFAVFTWDIWHVLMQHYGFMRIYDAKRGVVGAWAARMDWLVSASWYLTFIVLSPNYRHDWLYRAGTSGLPWLTPSIISVAQTLLVGFSTVLSVAYLIWQFRSAGGINWRKLSLLATFLLATWYLYDVYPDFLVGFAVWSAFHCLQYYAIVWLYNRKKVESDHRARGFFAFLFRPRWWLTALYVTLILAYGAINYSNSLFGDPLLSRVFMAFIITSGVLHYYYDGFIWKVREKDLARYLAVGSGSAQFRTRIWNSGWAHATLAVIALATLAVLERLHPRSDLEVRAQLAQLAPKSFSAWMGFGKALHAQGKGSQASDAYRTAITLSPGSAEAHYERGLALGAQQMNSEALVEFETTLQIEPLFRSAAYNAAVILADSGDQPRALNNLRAAFPEGDDSALRRLESSPGAAVALSNLALGFVNSGETSRAEHLLKRAVTLDPQNVQALVNLGNLAVLRRDLPAALLIFEKAISVDPFSKLARNGLGQVLLRVGRPLDARTHLEIAASSEDESVRRAALKALGAIR